MMPIRHFENDTPKIANTAYIDPLALVIGQVTVGEYASIFPMVVARGDVQAIHIGARTNVQDGSILHVTHDGRYSVGGRALIIGDSVTVGHQVILHACKIGDFSLIGMGSIIMDDAILEPYTLLGAGSLVPPNKVLTGKHLWHGRPVQKVRPLTDEELEYLEYSAEQYVSLSQRHAASLKLTEK
ncbi:isoleucine patch superfamily enzyme, carbonic anhydrase/acetyltransferase [Beggiatoa alba B18LD]|uniref:Isoleucine patch superfamily enzyme, carbonic anhydrase/acetyltransferase n=1 Tax=Beggiatoa alba B18LD TaxID=395493 RepID=I3CGU3_9GAMM|nr:gamma carbonic anhydrase family protein [Beggiatoa alba]EIJ42836.1 isoleucine patch superfamily enzyme, carbonic anhydrase/acetyltransferase [Beggiatoa alba B18LD]